MRRRTLAEAVEHESGRARALAMALDSQVTKLRLEASRTGEPDPTVATVDCWAKTALAIAEGLTKALADHPSKLQTMLSYASTFAVGLSAGLGTGAADAYLTNVLADPTVVECVFEFTNAANETIEISRTHQLETNATAEAHVSATGSVSAPTTDVAMAIGSANDVTASESTAVARDQALPITPSVSEPDNTESPTAEPEALEARAEAEQRLGRGHAR